ncbi:MAG: amidohydrolase [Pseudomonadota bacterium]|nr:amidohydrolase [Pseudomonadota bacterium]
MRFMAFVFVTACIALSGCASPPSRVDAAPADVVLRNGKILTVDKDFSIRQAIAIARDRIVAIGSDSDVAPRIGTSTRVVDLGGRTVIPGLIDAHLHSAGGGPGLDLAGARSIADLLQSVERAAGLAHDDELIVSNNDWHEAQLREKRLPHRTELDRVAPNHAVVLVRGGHEYILNSRALARWNITADTRSPAGGEIGRDAAGGLNGELVDNARNLITLPPPPKLVPEEIVAQMTRLNSVGITSIRIPGAFKLINDPITPYRFFQQLRGEGKLTLRVNYLMRIYDYSSPERMRSLIEGWKVSPDEGDEWLRIGGMKTLVDGGFEGGHMREPYAEPYGRNGTYKGIEVVPPERYGAIVRELNRLGWRVATHAVGDAAIDEVLDAYEAADRDRSIKGKMWVVEHAFIARPDHYPRMRALGLAISAQDHLYLAAPSMKAYWGAQRAHNVTPMATFLREGFLVAAGTDSPVIPYSPFWALYHFVTRDTISDGVYGPHERISREDALRTYTINNARLTFEQDIKGSLEVGKLADLVILSEDYLSGPEKQIEGLRALATMVGGRFVYTAPGYTP